MTKQEMLDRAATKERTAKLIWQEIRTAPRNVRAIKFQNAKGLERQARELRVRAEAI